MSIEVAIEGFREIVPLSWRDWIVCGETSPTLGRPEQRTAEHFRGPITVDGVRYWAVRCVDA